MQGALLPSPPIPVANRPRDAAFDVVRALCVINMIGGHVSGGTALYGLTRPFLWVDGSMGFVLISGLLFGAVHRRIAQNNPLRVSLAKVGRRVGDLYVLHVGLVFFALSLGSFAPYPSLELPSFDDRGFLGSVFSAAAMQIEPPFSILGMYVVFLVAAAIAIPVLRKGWSWLVLGASASVYVAAQLGLVHWVLPGSAPLAALDLASWQLLFIGAMVLGWNSRDVSLTAFLNRRDVLVVAVLLTAVGTALAQLWFRTDLSFGAAYPLMERGFDKLSLAPAVLVFACASSIVAYRVATTWNRSGRFAVLLDVLATLGRRGLGAYVVSTALAQALPSILGYSFGSAWAMVAAIGVTASCLLWAYYREDRLPERRPSMRRLRSPLRPRAGQS